MKKISTALAILIFGWNSPVFAQQENQNWYFGNNAGLSFSTGAPTALTNSSMVTYEAAASISDAGGRLLFYTNCVNVWNGNHQVMANGLTLGGQETASQGALILRKPGNSTQYYIFVMDGCDNQLAGGLKYSIVDMTQQNGLGSITSKANQVSNVRLTEKLTAVRHANGKDYWILVHGWETNNFYSYLFTGDGVSTTPVVTSIGSVHRGGGGSFGNANAVGYMKASPAGTKVALGKRDENFELFDFDNATGQLSNYVSLPNFYRSYGVEFSPDGFRLYGTTLDGNQIYQFNLQAGSAAAIAASATRVGLSLGSEYAGALQLGPDGKIYVALYNRSTLGVIETPNALGSSAGYRNDGPSLGGRLCQIGLPNFPNTTSSVVASTFARLSEATSLAPNPARGQVILTLPVAMAKHSVEVDFINVLGQTVAHESRSSIASPLVLSLAGLAQGVYTVRISSGVGVASKKLVVE